MQLVLQTQKMDDVAVIRCQGRIVTGDEVRALQLEFEKLMLTTNKIVLQLAEVNFIDSVGLGALVRFFGVLRNARGGLRLCQLSPFLLHVLEATNLDRVFQPCASEKEAIEAFSKARLPAPEDSSAGSKTRVVCIDTSNDLLAYLRALLQRSGYETFTTRYLQDARTLVQAAKASVVVCGPGTRSNEPAIEEFRHGAPHVPLLILQPDFSTAEASQAGRDLVNRIQLLLNGGGA
jgi:anti-sigma B factor antagonist